MRKLKLSSKNAHKWCCTFLLAFILVLAVALQAFAFRTVEYAAVNLGTQELFVVTNTRLLSAQERAEEISDHLKGIVADPTLDPANFEIRSGIDGVPVIMLGNRAVCTVSAQDAAASGKSELALAQDWVGILKTTLTQAKQVPTNTGVAHKNSALSEHAVLLLFLEIAILLLASLIFGELFVRLGQPAIIGQIVAGLVLGQTFFGTFFPDFSALLFPQNGSQSKLIEVISWIGVSFLLMLTGMETDISKLKRLGKPALNIAILGILGPLIAGCAASLLLPDQLLTNANQRLAFAVFLGTLFAASSVLVVATVLTDMKLIKRDIGQLVLSVALSHELLCCLLLAVIAVLSGSSSTEGASRLLIAVAGTACFVLVMYFGRPLFFAILRWVNDNVSTKHGLITAMVVLLLSCAAATQAAGIHIVLGAFAAGVILSQTPVITQKVIRPLETVTMGFFAPIFFASAGLNVNLTTLLSPQLAMITIAVALAAIASKLASCYVAGKLSGLGKWQSLAVGVSSNARGSMGLILALLGYSLNIITADMFAIVISVALLSTALAPCLMKWTLAKVQITEEEKARMANDERLGRTMLSTIRRVLWPTSGKGRNQFIAKFLESLGKRQVVEATVLWVKSSGSTTKKPFQNITKAINRKHLGLLRRTVKSEHPMEAIAEEANHGYDMLLMATDKPTADANQVFGELVDNVILHTSTRVLVVYEPEHSLEREIKKVLLAVRGTELSVSAGEFGISLAHSLNAKITCLCIEDSDSQDLYSEKTRSGEKIERKITDEIEGTLAELARALNVDFEAVLMQEGKHPAQAIILAAQRKDIDLIVLGAEPKLGKGLFLGHTINYVLRNAPCTIAVLKLEG